MATYDSLCQVIDAPFKNPDGSWKEDAGSVLSKKYVKTVERLHEGQLDMRSVELFVGMSMQCSRFLHENTHYNRGMVLLVERIVATCFWQILIVKDNSQSEKEAVLYIFECMRYPLETIGFCSIMPLSEIRH